MSSSDDEAEEVPGFVSEYYFEDDKEEPISFSVLPVCWNTSEVVEDSGKKVYLRGNTDDGLHKLYKPVKAWKFDISGAKPEISVLLKDNNWIKLQKPRKPYEEFSRKVLITVKFLHLVKRKPELYGQEIWDKLSKIFCLLEDKPSPDDLIDHKSLIEKAVEHDDSLRKSKFLITCLEKNLQKMNRDQEIARCKGKNDFIVADDDLMTGDLEGDSGSGKDGSGDGEDDSGNEDGDDDVYDSVCCICDEGGNILCCEGVCMRSFHATPEDARNADSGCSSLGFSPKEVKDMKAFKCKNCQHKLHQCYSCGQLGSSDKESGAEVFQCVNATCGYFYHPGCVAKQLHQDSEEAVNALQKDIAAGEPFTCPLHMCFVCRQPDDKTVPEMRMAVCRRCPKAYHKKCLPSEIPVPIDKKEGEAGDEDEDEDEDIVRRAWDELLVDRILIYCLDHEIIEDLGTPLRNHIKFPGDDKKKKQLSTQRRLKHKVLPQNKKLSAKAPSRQGSAFEPKKTFRDNQPGKTDKKRVKLKATDTLRNVPLENKPFSTKAGSKSPEPLDLVKPSKFDNPAVITSGLELDPDSETRILELIEEASSGITLDDVIKKHEKLIRSNAYKQKMDLCKSITLGKVEGSCKAVRAAAIKLDAGGSIEDAKAICEPKILDQVVKWKSKLRIYIAPFLHGMRYTSFGRHFTKSDKLKEIVDKIHWYVNNNDTIVDFCCGANDFSWLMKQKLESVGKTCHYKNYDLFQSKNDFSFEKRDWFSVQPKELPTGSQLIIGLNPPFGVKARLANRFINKALEFKPKLVILIVPPETERLDKKKVPYDLVWEDREKLSGRSFYLPGSIDVNEKQMEDWNVVAPILYLWSRQDWTAKHKTLAKKYGHLHGGERDQGNLAHKPGFDRSSDEFEPAGVTRVDNVSTFADEPKHLKERAESEKQSPVKDHGRGTNPSSSVDHRRVNANSRKRRHSAEINAKEDIESSREFKQRRSSPFNPHQGWPRHSPVNARVSPQSRYQRSPAFTDPGRDRCEGRTYGEGRIEFVTPVNYYDDRPGTHGPHIDMHPSGTWSSHADHPRPTPPPLDYPSQSAGMWASSYMGRPGGYGTNQPYIATEQTRPSLSAFMTESGYRREAVSTMEKYGARLDERNPSRMGNHGPDPGHPSGPGMYHHQAPSQGYPAVPLGFAQAPVRPFQHPHYPHSSSGGWINE